MHIQDCFSFPIAKPLQKYLRNHCIISMLISTLHNTNLYLVIYSDSQSHSLFYRKLQIHEV